MYAGQEKEEDEETLSGISRAVIEALPRLFTKHQTVPSRVVDLLAIPTLISLDQYLDLRMVTVSLTNLIKAHSTKHDPSRRTKGSGTT